MLVLYTFNTILGSHGTFGSHKVRNSDINEDKEAGSASILAMNKKEP